jgi:hypothetical protein
MVRTAQPRREFHDWQISKVVLALNDWDAAPPHIFAVKTTGASK